MTFFVWDIFKSALEVLILWIVYYRVLLFLVGTRAFQVFKGIGYLLIIFFFSQLLGFDTLNWLLTKFFAISIIAILIIFQPELRQGLARLGQQHLFNIDLAESEIVDIIEEVTSAAFKMAKNKIGCLIAIEREIKLKTYEESGVVIEAKISAELIQSIFTPPSPLHDGGIILRGDRVIAASCLFPLSDNPNFSKTMGTRHRAALGITEQTDTIVVMVSEAKGEISVALNGNFIHITEREQLTNILRSSLITPNKKKKGLFNK